MKAVGKLAIIGGVIAIALGIFGLILFSQATNEIGSSAVVSAGITLGNMTGVGSSMDSGQAFLYFCMAQRITLLIGGFIALVVGIVLAKEAKN